MAPNPRGPRWPGKPSAPGSRASGPGSIPYQGPRRPRDRCIPGAESARDSSIQASGRSGHGIVVPVFHPGSRVSRLIRWYSRVPNIPGSRANPRLGYTQETQALGRSGHEILWFSNPAGFWTSNRRFLGSKPFQKPMQSGGARSAPPLWLGFAAV